MDGSIVADMLVDPGGNKPDRDHWEKTSRALITCAGEPRAAWACGFWEAIVD